MTLKDTLDTAIKNGHGLARAIATSYFGDDSPESRTITRRWGIAETAELIGVSRETIRTAEADGRLPKPDLITAAAGQRTSRRAGYTIQQIDNMRDALGKRPSKGDHPAQVISNMGHKGGSWKTTVSVHQAQWSAIQGYKTLIIDIDPQATASLYHGYVADINTHESDTALPWMLGEADNLEYAIRETAWPGLHIIPSCLGMHRIESELLQRADAGELNHEPHMMLRAGIETIMDDYDIIIIDGSPNLGIGTVNSACAADIIICPTPAELNDYMSSVQFFVMLRGMLEDLDLGGYEPELRVLATKVSYQTGSQTQQMLDYMRQTLGGMMLTSVMSETAEVGKGQVRMRTIYEQDKDQRGTISAWKKATGIMEPVFEEILTKLIKPRWEQN
ncbi:AAA family ATPase [Oceanospirillum sp. HFRX-1_2]